MKATTWLFLAASFALSCKASVSGEANASTSGEANAEGNASMEGDTTPDFDKPLDEPMEETALSGDEPSTGELAPIGARQDLIFKGPGTIDCRCMSVALGDASDPKFKWGEKQPRTDPRVQFVLGFSSEDCEGADKGVRASYWGFQVKGNDVVVGIENSHEGRPLVVGAIIPKPLGDGQIYLRPVDKSVPFARNEGGRCKLGNPGKERTVADGPGAETGVRIIEPEKADDPKAPR